jgi:tetratricopeptide (TPR) repeat protein
MDARQWSRTAWAMALLFGSLPLASRLLLGGWAFEGAGALAFLFFVAGCYLRLASRRFTTLRDPAAMLDQALRLAASGRTERAIALLTRTTALSPTLWQALQYRGEIQLNDPTALDKAMADFDHAIQLAPGEAHLYALRGYAHALRNDREAALSDYQTAARLEGREVQPLTLREEVPPTSS